MEDIKTTEGQPQVGSDAWFALLPHSADGVPIMLGSTVYAENWDRSFFGDLPFLTIKVESLHLGKSFDEYEGAFTVSGSEWEGGNLDCYADSLKVPDAWANNRDEPRSPEQLLSPER